VVLVETVSLFSAGLNYTTGPSKATTIISGVGNNGLTVNITTVGVVGRVTIVTNTNLNKGNSITISGATEAGMEWLYTILAACDSLTAFDIIISATATLIPSLSQSTTLIVDSKNWVR
jgi:thiamine monophosphate kinase